MREGRQISQLRDPVDGWVFSRGRRSKLTPGTITDLRDALLVGVSRKAACSLVGIRPATLQDWLNQGRRDVANGNTSTREAAVFISVEWAEAEFQHRLIQTIQRSAEGGMVRIPVRQPDGTPVLDGDGQPVMTEQFIRPRWEAAAWTLERRFPEDWAKRSELTIQHNTSGRPAETLNAHDDAEKIITLFEQANALLQQARELADERERRRLERDAQAALPAPESDPDKQ